MRASIINNEFTSFNREGDFGYLIINWNDNQFNMFDIRKIDVNGNLKVLPDNIDTKNLTCNIIINPLYIVE